MAFADKHADEPTIPVEESLWGMYTQAMTACNGWRKIAEGYLKLIQDKMGDAFAIEVNGEKVATWRPTKGYATKALQDEYPDLTRHYRHEVLTDVFDIDLFAKAHPEIAERFRIRSFREVDTG